MGNKGLYIKKLNENPGPGTHSLNRGVVSTMLITGKRKVVNGKVMWPPIGKTKHRKKQSNRFDVFQDM